jgi:hypothetical protein
MVQFPPFWHRSRRRLVRLAPPNIQLEGRPRCKERAWSPGGPYSSQGGKRHAERRRLGHESRAWYVAGNISGILIFDASDYSQASRPSLTIWTIFLLISRRYSSMPRTTFHHRFTKKLRYFFWQPLACVCYPLKDRLSCFNLPASFSNSTLFFA